MKKSMLLILVIFFFLTTCLYLSANSIITYEEFLVMWQRAQNNIERNNPDGHSEVYTDTEMLPEGIELRIGWIEGVGIWGIKGFNWFEPGVIPAIGNGYYDEDGMYVPTDMVSPTNPGDNYTYFQLTLPPDPINIPPGTIFPSIGFYLIINGDFDLFSAFRVGDSSLEYELSPGTEIAMIGFNIVNEDAGGSFPADRGAIIIECR